MNHLRNAITCVNCKNVLESPVFLPCSHTICHKHTLKRSSDGEKRAVVCQTCNIEYAVPISGEFPPNTHLASVIESIGQIDYGQEYNDAKQSCQNFDQLLTRLEQVLNDPRNYTFDAICILKDAVQLRGEKLKLRIDDKMREFFMKLEKYEFERERALKADEFRDKLMMLELMKNDARDELAAWENTLNQIKQNQNEWRQIKSKSEMAIENFKSQLCQFRSDLLDQRIYNQFHTEIERDFKKLEDEMVLNLNNIEYEAFIFN